MTMRPSSVLLNSGREEDIEGMGIYELNGEECMSERPRLIQRILWNRLTVSEWRKGIWANYLIILVVMKRNEVMERCWFDYEEDDCIPSLLLTSLFLSFSANFICSSSHHLLPLYHPPPPLHHHHHYPLHQHIHTFFLTSFNIFSHAFLISQHHAVKQFN